MGAVLIARNDLSHHDPGAAARLEDAVARAVAPRLGAFRVSIERPLGKEDVVVYIEAHRPGDGPWRRELHISPETGAAAMEARLLAVLRS